MQARKLLEQNNWDLGEAIQTYMTQQQISFKLVSKSTQAVLSTE